MVDSIYSNRVCLEDKPMRDGEPENNPEMFVDIPDTSYDPVNRPQHYTSHPSGIECIQITRHMGFNLGNAMKYIWRADMKNGLEDLEKAKWYIQDEIDKRGSKG